MSDVNEIFAKVAAPGMELDATGMRKLAKPVIDHKLVEDAFADNLFKTSMRKRSPYYHALVKLMEHGIGKTMEFASVEAKTHIYQQAHKLGIKLDFAERNGKLYIRIKKMPNPVQAKVEDGPVGILVDNGDLVIEE